MLSLEAESLPSLCLRLATLHAAAETLRRLAALLGGVERGGRRVPSCCARVTVSVRARVRARARVS